MIHIATVHWNDDRWIDVQLRYLRQHLTEPCKVYAFLNGVPAEHREKYFYSSTEDIESHSVKLNLLADMACLHATEADDLLMFIDGDAFPIGDLVAYSREKLRQYPLIAVQRLENLGDVQPHPSFCMTTVGFWRSIAGDWKSGPRWQNRLGHMVTDVGGRLWGTLQERGIDWFPMLRSNTRDLHPLWFGVYDRIIYHHGAGFRDPLSRVDREFYGIRAASLPVRCYRKLVRPFFPRVDAYRHALKTNTMLGEQVFAALSSDPTFYRMFDAEDASIDLTSGTGSSCSTRP